MHLFATLLCALFLLPPFAARAATSVNAGTVSQINGPGGLDLTGTIAYAINFTPNDPPLTVSGVTFVPDSSLPGGYTVGANVTPWQTKPNFGAGADNNNLAEIYQDIRWANSGVGQTLEAHLPVTAGQKYKIQILFYANHAADDRRWDIQVEGALVVDEITSLGVSTGPSPGNMPPYSPNVGLVYSHTVTVGDASLDIRMGNFSGAFDGGDRNPIWQGLTVEQLPPDADSDGDGLPDAWEVANFGPNLAAQNGTGDPDGDSLPNSGEFARGTDPNDFDTDNDLLSDGAEVNVHLTNPLAADTDGDGLSDGAEVNTHGSSALDADSDDDTLSDGAEVNTHGSSPLSIDSDNDGFNDPTEVLSASNPAQAASTPGGTHIARVLGADASEGLDFQGTFAYAVNVGPDGAAGAIHDANFTADTDPGISIITSHNIASGGWALPALGSSPGDDALEAVFRDIRWSDVTSGIPDVTVTLANLIPGRQYKLQLLFGEQCCPQRTFDISVEGTLLSDNFNTGVAQGPVPMTYAGAAVVHTFTAGDNTLNILLAGAGVPFDPLLDRNAILSGLTLEEITIPVPLDITRVTRVPAGLKLDTRGTPGATYSVDWSPDLAVWEEVHDTLVHDLSGNTNWTDTAPARTGPAARRGFYKLRDPLLDPTP